MRPQRRTDRLCGARGQPHAIDRETATTHIARHQRARDSRYLSASVPRIRRAVIEKSTDFPVDSDEGDGLKNRRGERKKIAIAQVLACRILSFCGEVERLKAAVC